MTTAKGPRTVLLGASCSASATGRWSRSPESPGISLLLPTRSHAAVLEQTAGEVPDVRGNQMYDLHTAVLMREHGVSRICARDTGFHRFPFLTVVDPLRRG